MGSGRARKIAALGVFAIVLGVSAVLVASAAPSTRTLKYACASDLYNAKDVLHFVSRPSKCRGSGKKLVTFANDFPVYVCRKEHGGFASARARRFPYPLGIRSWGPAGLVRMVSNPSRCAPASQPNETPITLPATTSRMFCAAKRGGELRWVSRATSCDRKEFPVKLAKRSAPLSNGEVRANDDSGTTDENTATTINVLANDSGPGNSGKLTISAIDTTGTVGKVTKNADDTITYDPDGKFESLKPGQTATDSFQYTAKKNKAKSDQATVTIAIMGTNDAPVAVDDTSATDEDHTKSISVLPNDTDKESDTLHVASVDGTGTQGNVTVNGDGTVAYDPNGKFDSLQGAQTATDSFKYKASDGSADSNAATVTVTITAVNDAPVLSGVESSKLNYLEGSAAAALTGSLVVADADDANVHSATVKIGTGFDAAHDALHFSPQNAITGTYNSGTGVLTLTGSDSKEHYRDALRSVSFDSTGGLSGDRTVSFQVEDGQPANKDSNVVSRVVTVDKAPVAADDSKTLAEDAGAVTIDVLANDSDGGDGGPKTVESKTNGTNGTVAITNGGADLTYTPALNFCSTDSFTYTLNGGSTATVSITVTCVNDAPVNTVPGAQTVNEDGNIVFSNAFLVADVDAAGDTVSTTLAVPNGTISVSGGGAAVVTGNGTSSVQVTGSLAAVNSKISSVTYAPDANVNGLRTLSMDTDDQAHNGSGGAKTAHDTVAITINPVNDAPVNTMPAAGQSVDEDTSFAPTPSPSVQDVDAGAAGVQVTLSVDHGVLHVNSSGQSFTAGANDSGSMTFTGTVSQVNAAMLGLTYKGNPNYNLSQGAETLTMTTSDLGNTGSGGTKTDTDSVGLTVDAVNDAPVNSVPDPQSTNEDTPETFSTANGNLISVADVDVAPNDLRVTLSVSHGLLTLSGTSGLSFACVGCAGDGTADASMTFSGTPAAINTALAGLSYAPAGNYDVSQGAETLTLLTEDLGSTGSGGAKTDSDTVGITVVAQNDAPANNLTTTTQSVNEDTQLTVSPSPSIADSDAAGANVKVTLSVLHGGLTLGGTTNLDFGCGGCAGDGSGDQTMTFTGTVADVNTALSGLKYQGDLNYNSSQGPETLTLTTNDQGNTGAGGPQSDADSVGITVNAINDAPSTTAPLTESTNEDISKVFSTANGNAITVTDVDADPSTVQVNLSVTSGTLTLSGTTGLTLTGNGTNSLQATGTLANVNAALNGLTYKPNDNFNSSDTLQITTTDNGNTGAGAVGNDSDSVAITVNAVNDAPKTTVPAGQSVNEDSDLTFSQANLDPIAVTDVDADPNDIKLTLTVSSGTLTLATTSGLNAPIDNGTNNVKVEGTLAEVNAALDGLTYRGTLNTFGSDTLNIATTDLGHNPGPTAGLDSDSVAITVTAVNDAPVLDLHPGGPATPNNVVSFNETSPHDNSQAVVLAPNATLSDVDTGTIDHASVTLASRPDGNALESLSATGTANISAVYTQSSGELALSSASPQPLADYLAVLKTVRYDNTKNPPSAADRTVTFVVNDGATNSNAPTATVHVVPINAAPVLDLDPGGAATPNSTASFTEDSPAVAIAPNTSVSDADAGDQIESAEVKITNIQDGAAEVLAADVGATGIVASYSSGTLSLTGVKDPSVYAQVLKTVTYNNTSNTPNTTARTIQVKVFDGQDFSNVPTSTVSVATHNDAPVVTTTGGSSSYTENAAPVPVDGGMAGGVTVTDADSATLAGATVQVTTNYQNGQDALALPLQASGITATYAAGTGTLTLSKSGSPASVSEYQTALRAVTYEAQGENLNPSTRTIVFQVDDGAATNNLSNTATKTVTVTNVNDAPALTQPDGALSYTEDSPTAKHADQVAPNLTASDPDNPTLASATVQITGNYQNGQDVLSFTNNAQVTGNFTAATGTMTLTPTGPGSAVTGDFETALKNVRYANTSDNPIASARTVSFQADDGQAANNLSTTVTRTINVVAVNDPPVISVPVTQTTDEDTPKKLWSTDGNAISVSDPDVGTGDLKVTLSVSGGTLTLASTTGLTFTPAGPGNDGTADTSMTFTGTQSAINTALAAGVTFNPTTNLNGPAAATLTVLTEDQGNSPSGNLTDSDSVAFNITAVNDPPTAVNDTASTDEDTTINAPSTTAPVNAPNVLTNDTDPDTGDTQTVTKLNGSATLTGSASDGAAVTINANGTWTYNPGAVHQGLSTGETAQATFTYTMKDSGNAESTATVTITINGVSDPPVANPESYDGIGNTNLFVSTTPPSTQAAKTLVGSVKTNDTDPDTPFANLTIQATTGQATTAGGTVDMGSDGSFTYKPEAGDTGLPDTFTYRICDVPTCNSSTPANDQATATVTIPLAGQVWYVRNTNATAGDGTSDNPFKLLSSADSSSSTGDTTFVFKGDGSQTGYDAGYTMASGERLIGEVDGLTLDPDGGGPLGTSPLYSAAANAYPQLTSLDTDVVTLGPGAELRGFGIDQKGTGGGVSGTGLGNTTVTLDDLDITDAGTAGTQPGLELDTTSSTTTNISKLNVSTKGGATAVRVSNAGTTSFLETGAITLSSAGGKALDANSTNMGTGASKSVFDSLTSTGSNNGGVNLTGTTGTSQLGDGSGTDLALATTSGTEPALKVSNGGTVSVPGGGTANLTSVGGPAADITGTAGATFDLDDVDSTNSANDGINIDGLGNGTFSASSGDIGGADAISFDLNGGSGAINYAGTLNNGDGTTAIDITGRSGGTGLGGVTLSGPINDTNDAGGTINVTGNSAGDITFSNATKQANTGASTGVNISHPDTSTALVAFTNGGLDIDTSSASGFVATGSNGNDGNVEVSGTGNTINATALAAGSLGLQISNTNIANSDVTFQRVATSGGLSGIALNNTGNSNGRLLVTGSSSGVCGGNVVTTNAGGFTNPTVTNPDTADCTGGTILNAGDSDATAGAISLNSVPGGASLTRMYVSSSANDGIEATDVGNGVTLDRVFVENSGNSLEPVTNSPDRGLDFTTVTGTSTVTQTSVTGSYDDNAHWENNGTNMMGLTVANSRFADNSAATGADGLHLRGGTGTPTMTASIHDNAFIHNRDDGFQLANTTPSSAQMNVTFSDNDIVQGVNNVPNNDTIHASNGSNADTKFKMDNNDLTGANGSAVILNPGPDGTSASSFDGIVTNNVIGTGATDSGSVLGIGLWGRVSGNGVNRFEIRNNLIRNYQQQGMYLRGNEGNGQQTSYTVTGNTIGTQDGDSLVVLLEAGSVSADTTTVCADFGGAGALANTVFDRPTGNDIGVARDIAGSTLNLVNYAGGDLTTYFRGRNNPATFTAVQSGTTPGNAGGSCALPTTPPLP